MIDDANVASVRVRIRVFGPFVFEIDGKPFKAHTRRHLTVLAYLLLKRGAPVDRNELGAACWPAGNEGRIELTAARKALSTALSDLLKRLSEQGQSGRLVMDKTLSVSIDTSRCDVDLHTWEAALGAGDIAAVERAVALHQGNVLLAGWNDAWVAAARSRIHNELIGVLSARTRRAEDHGEWEWAERCFRILLEVDGWRDETVVSLLDLLCARRQFTRMAEFYDEAVKRRNEQASGDHYIRRHYTAANAKAQRFIASLESGNLPQHESTFVPRPNDIREVCRIVRSHRLCTLFGAGGAGKTRLAIAAGEALQDDFYDRAWFVDLSNVTAPEAAPHAVAHAMRLKIEPGEPLDMLCDALRAKEALLILDNAEHLIDACAVLVERVLRTCPGIRILASSRSRFDMTGEAAWHVSGLAVPEPADARKSETLERFGAVELLVERASVSGTPFVINAANADAVVAMCRRLDGIPLAIELAAVQITQKHKTAQMVADSIEHSLASLNEGSRTAPLRHKSLEAVVAWSWNLLTELERSVCSRLGVFPGDFTLEAAVAACVDVSATHAVIVGVVHSLEAQSLIVARATAPFLRYYMLSMIREFARFKC